MQVGRVYRNDGLGFFLSVLITVFMLMRNTLSDRRCGGIPNATPIKGHINDLFFDAWLVGPLVTIELESALTVFTAVAGPPARLMTMSAKTFAPDSFRLTTVATRNDDSYHTLLTRSPPSSHDRFFIYTILLSCVFDNCSFEHYLPSVNNKD